MAGAMLVATACGSGGSGEHAWVAVGAVRIQPGDPRPIRVFDALAPETVRTLDAATTGAHTLGKPGLYVGLRWSPDARQLAALDVREATDRLHLRLFDREGGGEHAVDLPGRLVGYAWSPDSTRIAFLSWDRVIIIDRTGRVIGDVEVPARPDGSGSAVGEPSSTNWSPDSRYFAAGLNDALVIVDRDAKGRAYDPSQFAPAARASTVGLVRWTSGEQFIVRATALTGTSAAPPPPLAYDVTVASAGPTWTMRPAPAEDFTTPDMAKAMDAFRAAFPGTYVGTRYSSDGSAILFELISAPGAADQPPRIVIWRDGQFRTVALTTSSRPQGPGNLRGSYDVVFTGKRP